MGTNARLLTTGLRAVQTVGAPSSRSSTSNDEITAEEANAERRRADLKYERAPTRATKVACVAALVGIIGYALKDGFA